MKKRFFYYCISFLFLFLEAATIVNAQETAVYGKNAFSINLTRLAISEVNLSYEHFLNSRRSIEFDGGLVYTNNFLNDQIKDWSKSTLFSEHGFAGRFHYKIFKRLEEKTRWREYISPGIVYKNLYYNDKELISFEKLDYFNLRYKETYLQKRSRSIFGVEFLWGKVFEPGRTLTFDFYYGAGINATISKRTDYNRYANYVNPSNQSKNQSIPDFEDKSFYMRPYILIGLKLRLNM